MLNVYITLTMLGWGSAPWQVLILDAHRPASLDLLWPVVAAGESLITAVLFLLTFAKCF